MTYKETLEKYMQYFGQHENSIFIGQQIVFPGNPMSTTLRDVPKEKMVELPVMEESQMGISLGLALAGKTVVTFYPRWDFLLCATNQLVNHVDKIGLMSKNQWNPHLLIRVGKGSDVPLDPGHQHKGNYLTEFSSLCKNIKFYDLKTIKNIETSYDEASLGGIHVLVEYPELYTSEN